MISHNLASININYIYDKSLVYNNFLKDLSTYKLNLEKEIKLLENKLLEDQKSIEENQLILNNDEITKLTNQYQIDFEKISNMVKNINDNISQNIRTNQNIINKQIILISQNIAKENNIDLIIESKDFFISSDQIDISNKIIELLNNIDFKLTINPI